MDNRFIAPEKKVYILDKEHGNVDRQLPVPPNKELDKSLKGCWISGYVSSVSFHAEHQQNKRDMRNKQVFLLEFFLLKHVRLRKQNKHKEKLAFLWAAAASAGLKTISDVVIHRCGDVTPT